MTACTRHSTPKIIKKKKKRKTNATTKNIAVTGTTMMTFLAAALLAVVTTTTTTTTVVSVHGLPLQATINQRQSECLHDRLEEGESVTMSVFVLSGSQLKATVTLEGPTADASVDNGIDLHAKVVEYTTGKNKPPASERIDFSEVVDFEHLNQIVANDDQGEESESMVDDELKQPIDPNDPDVDGKRRERREKQRAKFLEQKQKREQRKLAQVKQIRQDGEPFVYTTKAPTAGWYRACVHSTWNQVVVEMELRKETDLGGLDETTGHVKSYEEQQMLQEDQELEQDTASDEGIKDEDFEEARSKVKDLRRLLNEIQSMQQRERRRLTVHAETNEHSHSRMVLSSLMETLLFMAVTGYQVYTIRKWFSGAPVLGR
mmetsp:Transcript_47029/g.114761  ORF Transcript_47029/g.114761 Transcript_47029/m.114761 type:complete len:374 (+) Transcript_47029:2-1123(+)